MSAPVEPDPPPRKLGLTKAQFLRVNAEKRGEVLPENDPLEILKGNRAHETENNSKYDQTPPPGPRVSRKMRDYLISLVIVDAIIIGMIWMGIGSMVFEVAALGIFTGGYTWYMLVVVDDY